MADPPPADTPAASTRDRNVVAEALAVDRSSASPIDAAAQLFSADWEQADFNLAATIPSPARAAVREARDADRAAETRDGDGSSPPSSAGAAPPHPAPPQPDPPPSPRRPSKAACRDGPASPFRATIRAAASAVVAVVTGRGGVGGSTPGRNVASPSLLDAPPPPSLEGRVRGGR